MTTNNDREFDGLLKDKLQNYVSPVPDHIWDEIERKQGFFFYFKHFIASNIGWLLLPFGTIAIALLYFGMFNEPTDATSQVIVGASQMQFAQADHQNHAETAQNSEKDDALLKNAGKSNNARAFTGKAKDALTQRHNPSGNGDVMAAGKRNEAISNRHKGRQQDANNSNNKLSTRNNTYNLTEKPSGYPAGNGGSPINAITYVNSTTSPDLEQLAVNGAFDSHTKTSNTTHHSPDKALAFNGVGNVFDGELSTSGKYDDETPPNKVKQNADALAAANSHFIQKHTLLQSIAPQVSNKLQFTDKVLERKGKNGLNCYSFIALPKRISVDYLVGIGLASRSMTARNGDTNYLHLREDLEVPNYYLTTGIRVGYSFKNQMSLRAGLIYTQLNETLRYKVEDEISNIVYIAVDTIVVNTDTTFVVDTLYINEPVISVVEKKNRYRFLDVPLTVGYDFHHKCWVFGVNAGLMLNLLFEQQGEIFDADEELIDLAKSNEVFKRHAGLSLYGSLSMGYKLTPRLYLLAEPTVRHVLKPLTKDSHAIEQRYFNVGLNAGLRVQF